VVPLLLWGTQRLLSKDHPGGFSRGTAFSIRICAPLPVTEDDVVAQTAHLKHSLQGLLDEAITSYPQHQDGAWWLPASYGGTAPTLEEAARLDAAERRIRAARRSSRGR
jgi:hypothetical protein